VSDLQRFQSKYIPEPNSGCWLWIGATTAKGYGSFWANGKSCKAHRWSYRWKFGPIPKGLQIDHLCRVRSCVNPQHLEPVTNAENIKRGETGKHSRAAQTHCIYGHPLSGLNLYVTKQGYRQCRACNARRQRESQARKRD